MLPVFNRVRVSSAAHCKTFRQKEEYENEAETEVKVRHIKMKLKLKLKLKLKSVESKYLTAHCQSVAASLHRSSSHLSHK